jgi:hypothetical protein
VGVDGNLLAGWEQSAGLRAPPAPADGALVPNGTGYLLAVGPVSQRIYPKTAAAARVLSGLSLPIVAAMPFLLVPAPYGPLGVAVLGALACWLPRALLDGITRSRLVHRMETAPARATIAAAPGTKARAATHRGRVVRFTGTVAEQATVPSLFTGRPVVLATSDCAGVAETRGIDFDVQLAGGERVRVPARDALLLGRGQRVRGQPSCGPLMLTVAGGATRLQSALLSTEGWLAHLLGMTARELTLGPGDTVEICGVLDFEPDPDTQRGFARGPALRAVLRPSGGVPVIVRKQAAPEVGALPPRPGTVTSDGE